MKPKTIAVCLLLLLLGLPVVACINLSPPGSTYRTHLYLSSLNFESAFNKNLKPDGIAMEARLRGATNFNDRSDYSVALMFQGRSGEAIELLQKLEQEKPGQFYIAANLGTAYELVGNNRDALKWINEGIKRNPDDHAGTEWLHAKILEVKIAHAADPNYFERHSVLELDRGSIGETATIGDGRRFDPLELARTIRYQLGERMQFVKPSDPVVASLLFDYAAIEAALNSMESAKPFLEMATRYGYPAAKVVAFEKAFERRRAWQAMSGAKVFAFIVLGVVALYLLYKWWRRNAKAVGAAA